MTLVYIFIPIFSLAAACVGYGLLPMALFRSQFGGLPIFLRLAAAYFLGQGLLTAFFVFIALAGEFNFIFVVVAIVFGAILGALFCWLHRYEIRVAVIDASKSWSVAPWPWRMLTVLAALLFAYGFSTIGRTLEVDAVAFYLAAAKLIAYTGRIGTLPGYESFSWVIMTAEMSYATLMVLGAPGVSARFYEWVNFAPALVALYSVVRVCQLSARAASLSVVLALTSSAAISLWGGGKADTFAVGPAFIAVWFALASWRSARRTTFVAMSGLFCGLAIVTKASYLVILLPSTVLLVFWLDIAAVMASARVFDWGTIYRQAKQMAITGLSFGGGLAFALAAFVIKNLIIFQAMFPGANSLASSAYFSRITTARLIASYPLALTYGHYWAQGGNLSPLILGFFPLFFMIPRGERQLISPVAALTISAIAGVAIWIILMPSLFMPRYILATLLLLGVPAAAGAAYASRRRDALSVTIILTTAITIVLTPKQVKSWTPIFFPARSIDYLSSGREDLLFVADGDFGASAAVNSQALASDRVLLLVYPRLWLRGDLLASTSTASEVYEAKERLARGSSLFWSYLEEKHFRFLVVDGDLPDKIRAAATSLPAGFELCEISSQQGVSAFQIGRNCNACPPGDRTVLTGPFSRVSAGGNAFVVTLAALASVADSSRSPLVSPVVMCEDEVRLGPPHSVHLDIQERGGGRFSHWENMFYFSASDNSDPGTNGRKYTAVRPR